MNTKEKHILSVTDDGTIRHLHSDELGCLGKLGSRVEIDRASNVEYDNKNQWWYADLRPAGIDKVMTGFSTRAEALEAEREYLEHEVI